MRTASNANSNNVCLQATATRPSLSLRCSKSSPTLLATAKIKIRVYNGREIIVRAFLD